MRWARLGCCPESAPLVSTVWVERVAQPSWFGVADQAPAGPRTGKIGFGSFCRNKSASSRGGETPHFKVNFLRACRSGLAMPPLTIEHHQKYSSLISTSLSKRGSGRAMPYHHYYYIIRVKHDFLASSSCVGQSDTSSGKIDPIFRCLSIPGYLYLTPISSVMFFQIGSTIWHAPLFAHSVICHEHKTIHAEMAKSQDASEETPQKLSRPSPKTMVSSHLFIPSHWYFFFRTIEKVCQRRVHCLEAPTYSLVLFGLLAGCSQLDYL